MLPSADAKIKVLHGGCICASLGLGLKPYARLMKINPNCLRAWEFEKKRISKNSWEKYFKGIVKI